MAKLIYEGWSKPGEEIPQPISVVLGSNLKQNFKPQAPPKDEDKQDPEPAEAGGANKHD